MINLLPPEEQRNFNYARLSTRLMRFSVGLFIAIIGVWAIVAVGLFYINQSVNTYSDLTSKTKQELKDQKLDETGKRVEDISSSLKLVVSVLSREVLFSKLVTQIGNTIPPNAILTNLKIAKTEGGIDLSAAATDYNTATQVQVNLADPANKIFDKADILNITCSNKSTDPNYPCTVTIRAQFAKSNPFLFINSSGGSQ